MGRHSAGRTSATATESGRKGQVEVYTDQPELAEKPGVPKGKLTQQEALGEQDLPRHHARLVGLRPRAVQGRPARLRHGLSGRRRLHGLRADRLRQPDRQGRDARDGRRLHQPRQRRAKAGRGQRSFEYDTLSDQYARFLLEEILPEVEKTVKLRHDAESRAIAGISSGGICAWTVAWERPDEFRKVLSWVGSFTNIASGKTRREGGHNYEALIRKTPKKPIRVFLQDGANDLDNDNGNWPLANQQMAKALAVREVRLSIRLRRGLPQQPPRPRHPARLAPLALARLQTRGWDEGGQMTSDSPTPPFKPRLVIRPPFPTPLSDAGCLRSHTD